MNFKPQQCSQQFPRFNYIVSSLLPWKTDLGSDLLLDLVQAISLPMMLQINAEPPRGKTSNVASEQV